MAAAIACVAASAGDIGLAVLILSNFDLCCRTSEGLAIRTEDVIPPVAGTKFSRPAVNLNPAGERHPSKTGVYDEVLMYSGGSVQQQDRPSSVWRWPKVFLANGVSSTSLTGTPPLAWRFTRV